MSDWVPTPEAWDKFLSLLGPDYDVAADKYEGIRRRLIVYFEGRKCQRAEDLADKTITRVIKRNYDGVHIDDVMRYSYGVARIVRLEDFEILRKEDCVRDELLRGGSVFVDPKDPYDENDLRYAAFEDCLEQLSAANRTFILNYYEETGRAKINNRKSLREMMAISHNAVTLRAYQIRKKLEKCIKSRLKPSLRMKEVRRDSH
jgi:DNA-directed RNA polymerase specialized sigma24 family protein